MARTPKPKPLTEKQRPIVEAKWESAVADPESWRNELLFRAADEYGYTRAYDPRRLPHELVAAAWGLSADGRTPLPQFA